MLTDCSLNPERLLEDLSQKDEEFQLCNQQIDRRTETVTPRAPVGAKKFKSAGVTQIILLTLNLLHQYDFND